MAVKNPRKTLLPAGATRKSRMSDQLQVWRAIRQDPMFIPRDCIGHDHWRVGEEMIRAIAKPHARVACKACHASSKTFTATDVIFSFVLSGGAVVVTSSSWLQVKDEIFAEMGRTHADSRFPLGGNLLTTEYRVSKRQWALGLSTNKGVRFQGFHAAAGGKMLIVIDEAPGVGADIWEAIEGIRAGGDVRILALGNPTIPSGEFYNIFSRRESTWTRMTIDAFETPNFEDEEHPGHFLTLEQLLELPEHRIHYEPRPYLITRQWVLDAYKEWGPTSPRWESRVRGQFPQQAPDALIAISWIEYAKIRQIEESDTWEWGAGIDVAGPGEDETVVTVVHGPHIVLQKAFGSEDPRGDVLDVLEPYRHHLMANRRKSVRVDSIGIGYYFARHLEDNGYRDKVADINVGLPARNPGKYRNLRAEHFWGLRMRFQEEDVFGEIDDVCYTQLAAIKYSHNARGQVEIESKDNALKRGVKSPDRAESLMLAYADPGFEPTPVDPIGIGSGKSLWNLGM